MLSLTIQPCLLDSSLLDARGGARRQLDQAHRSMARSLIRELFITISRQFIRLHRLEMCGNDFFYRRHFPGLEQRQLLRLLPSLRHFAIVLLNPLNQ